MEPIPPEVQGTLDAMKRAADDRAKCGPSDFIKRHAWERADCSRLAAFFPKRVYFLLWLGTLCGLWFVCLLPALVMPVMHLDKRGGAALMLVSMAAGIYGYILLNFCSVAGRQWLFSRAPLRLVFDDLKIIVREQDLSRSKIVVFAVFGLPTIAIIAALVIWFG